MATNTKLLIAMLCLAPVVMAGTGESGSSCDRKPSSDAAQREQQERILADGTAQVGMPAIKNFRERRLLKEIIEMRDQDGLLTYTYMWSDVKGEMVFLCDSIGYPLSASMQFTNPQKIADWTSQGGYAILPQADPNGLFSPSSSEGSWVMCLDPVKKKAVPQYSEPRLVTLSYKR